MEHETGSGEAGLSAWAGDAVPEKSPVPDSLTPEDDVPGHESAGALGSQAAAAGSQAAAPTTGEPRVDAALKLLDSLPSLPVVDHPELFEKVHAELSEVLGELDFGATSGPRQADG